MKILGSLSQLPRDGGRKRRWAGGQGASAAVSRATRVLAEPAGPETFGIRVTCAHTGMYSVHAQGDLHGSHSVNSIEVTLWNHKYTLSVYNPVCEKITC